MDWSYAVTPFAAWFCAGVLKFVINSARARRWAFGEIGYGGLPSNHSTIVSSMATLIALKEGMAHPAFGVALTLAFIVILDAASLRRQVGLHAQALNQLRPSDDPSRPLRERMGHSKLEIAAGVVLGVVVGSLMSSFTALSAR